MSERDHHWMALALEQAHQAAERDEVPVGAVLVKDDTLLAATHNLTRTLNDPCAHAEIIALREGARVQGNHRLNGCTLYVTLEPCMMCAGALVHARIDRLVYATADPKTGVVNSVMQALDAPHHNHRVQVTCGVEAEAAKACLQAFFQARR